VFNHTLITLSLYHMLFRRSLCVVCQPFSFLLSLYVQDFQNLSLSQQIDSFKNKQTERSTQAMLSARI